MSEKGLAYIQNAFVVPLTSEQLPARKTVEGTPVQVEEKVTNLVLGMLTANDNGDNNGFGGSFENVTCLYHARRREVTGVHKPVFWFCHC